MASHQGDLALCDVAAVRQDGQDGGRVQQPVNHVDDAVGGHDVGAGQADSLLPQQDFPLRGSTRRSTNTHSGFINQSEALTVSEAETVIS